MKPMLVMYTPAMQAPAQGASPSAAKPAQVMATWAAEGLDIQCIEPRPVSVDDICRAHDRAFVEAVLALERDNGFGTRSAEVARSLPFTSGAMLDGARVALRRKTAVCAPVSGFHHAEWAYADGFCTFNGLMITALALKAEGLASKVSIIDCDHHYGNGTDEILDHLGKPEWIHHFSAGNYFRKPAHVPEFFERLERELERIESCDVVLYQAGADPHIDDPFGGWLTTEQLRQRDSIVFERAKRLEKPIVWNFAGGYQRDATGAIPKVIAIHTNTALEHLRHFCDQSPEPGKKEATSRVSHQSP